MVTHDERFAQHADRTVHYLMAEWSKIGSRPRERGMNDLLFALRQLRGCTAFTCLAALTLTLWYWHEHRNL